MTPHTDHSKPNPTKSRSLNNRTLRNSHPVVCDGDDGGSVRYPLRSGDSLDHGLACKDLTMVRLVGFGEGVLVADIFIPVPIPDR